MSSVVLPSRPRGLALMFGWRRLAFTLAFATAIGLLMGTGWKSGLLSILERTIALGLIAMLVFGLFEQWPRRLPRWLGRWALQVVAVAIAMPISTVDDLFAFDRGWRAAILGSQGPDGGLRLFSAA